MQTAIGADPHPAIVAHSHAADAVEPGTDRRPVAPVIFPHLIAGGAPDLAIRQLDEYQPVFGCAFVRRNKVPPFLFMVARDASFATDPQVPILRGEKSRELAAQVGLR